MVRLRAPASAKPERTGYDKGGVRIREMSAEGGRLSIRTKKQLYLSFANKTHPTD